MDVELECGETAIRLKFSRLYKLENSYTIECEGARISGRLFDPSRLQIERDGSVESISAGSTALYDEYARKLVHNFIGVIQGRETPLFVAQNVAPSITVMEEAYQIAIPFELPWYDADPNIELLQEGH